MTASLEEAHKTLREFFPVLKAKFEEHITSHTLGITETHRSIERQKALYAKGRTTPGEIVTNVDGVKVVGKHNAFPSKAIDVCVINKKTEKVTWDEAYYKILGHLCDEVNEELGTKVVWGGTFKSIKDCPHFEM